MGIVIVMVLGLFSIFTFHAAIIESGDNYPEADIVSENGEYVLHTVLIEDEAKVSSVTFTVTDAEDTELFACPELYRAYDLKGISWDGLDVVVDSADVGTCRYAHSDDGWILVK